MDNTDVTKAEILEMLIKRNLQVDDVLQVIIEQNGFVGVGIITFMDNLKAHMLKTNPSKFSQEAMMSM